LAGELVIKGNYYGFNLFVLNPSSGNSFCVTKVLVNNNPTKDEINSNAFEIDFSLLNVKIGEPVTVVIIHKEGCAPKIINPKALQPSENVSFAYIKVDKNSKLLWSVNGEMPDENFEIEQYRWNKWIKIGDVSPADSLKKNIYSLDVPMHSGYNQFRIVFNDVNDNPVYSKTVKTYSKSAEITLESTKVGVKINFSAETHFEIFDLKGNFITEGSGKEIDVTDLEKGKYWLNYDNKSVNFVKK
jgi:hypothetical protein